MFLFLVCYFYHAVSYDRITVCVTFLKFFGNNIFTKVFIFHMHHRIAPR